MQLAKAELIRANGRAASQQRFDPRQHFTDVEWLGDEVIGASLKAATRSSISSRAVTMITGRRLPVSRSRRQTSSPVMIGIFQSSRASAEAIPGSEPVPWRRRCSQWFETFGLKLHLQGIKMLASHQRPRSPDRLHPFWAAWSANRRLVITRFVGSQYR